MNRIMNTFVLTAAVALVLTASCNMQPDGLQFKTIETEDFVKHPNAKEEDIGFKYKVSFTYPSEYNDQAVLDSLQRKFIRFTLGKKYDSLTPEKAIDSLIADWKTEYEERNKENREMEKYGFEMFYKNTVSLVSDDLFQVVSEYDEYKGGAHNVVGYSCRLFNRQTGSEYSRNDIFKSEASDHIYRLIINKLLIYWQLDSEDEVALKTENVWRETTNFTVTPQGIEIHYSDYELGSYILGHPEIFIPYDQIFPYLRDRTPVQDFASQQADNLTNNVAALPLFEGKEVWIRNYGGSDEDYFSSVTVVADGFVAAGYSMSQSFGSGDWEGFEGKNLRDAIIVKFDKTGNVVWKNTYAGNAMDYYCGVISVSDGIIAAGIHSDAGCVEDWETVEGGSAIIVKYGFDGKPVWEKSFGGQWGDDFEGITAVSDGFVAVGSTCNSWGDWQDIPSRGFNDAIIVKFDFDGNVVWKRRFGGSHHESFVSVTTVSDGVVAVGNSAHDSFGSGDWEDENIVGKGESDAIIVKYDFAGNVVWKKNFGGSDYDFYHSVTAVTDGVVAVGRSSAKSFETGDWEDVTGMGYDDAIIVKYDFAGNVVWQKNFGGKGSDEFSGVTTVTCGIIAVGGKNLVKFDNDGNVLWKGSFFGKGKAVAKSCEGIVAAGFASENDFDADNQEVLTAKGEWDAIIVYYK